MQGELNEFILFLGRFHPLVVHLPIGFLILAFIFEILVKIGHHDELKKASTITFLLSGVSGIVAVILGFFLSFEGGYNEDTLQLHKWGGIITALLAILIWILKTYKQTLNPALMKGMIFLSLLSVIVTGHFGGNLTHGSTYLTEYSPKIIKSVLGISNTDNELPVSKVNNIDSAVLFTHLVHPILIDKCISCHNDDKKKGDLLFTNYEQIMEGGENGVILQAGNIAESELIHRITLPEHHKEIMPPEGKTPLTTEEIEILKFWIKKGATKDVLFTSLESDVKIKKYVSEYLGLEGNKNELVTGINANQISDSILNLIKEEGIIIRKLSDDSPFLDVSFTNIHPDSILIKMASLEKIKQNIAWLDLSNKSITDDDLTNIMDYNNLIKLRLDNNNLSENICQTIKKLEKLQYLNLYGNSIKDNCKDWKDNLIVYL